MASIHRYINHLVLVVLFIVMTEETWALTKSEKNEIRNEVKEMFFHAYRSYMNNAYPHDELMPLSCQGRHRGTHPSRGDVDDVLGNFSLTLVDSFDTLVILGELDEFEKAVKLIIRDVTFDRDIVVSVFETNIRMLGGLLSGHVLADKMRQRGKVLSWYKGELLDLAKDLGYRLLPAFNTSTGIPYPRVNLIHGVKQEMARTGHERDTCTACAGTMLLEFAALSRLSGEPIFEAKAHKAMDSLWQYRHRSSNLVGTVINIHNGEWVRRDAGIGAGTDSYYEYLLKAYILLGDDTYLDRFNKHYESIMKYINQGPIMLDVHMHRPHSNSKNFMDSLFAFWPGLQVLKGDIKPAIEIHEMLYQVMQRHNFLPEAFTTDFRVHWAQHPLRPEFIESTYFLHRATGDPHYLEVGKKVIDNLNKHAKVPCGYASIKDVTTGKHEDQMDSFVLSETFKYLYLLFSEDEDLLIDIDDYIFTTEAHLLPLTLSLHENTPRNITKDGAILYNAEEQGDGEDEEDVYDDEADRTCPNNAHVYKNNLNFAHTLRVPLRNLVENVCPKPRQGPKRPRLYASEFIAGNVNQVTQLQRMGIRIVTMSDGRVQLLHTASDANSVEDAEDGMLFMQEMIELSKTQAAITQQESRVVQVLSGPYFGNEVFNGGPAQFGYNLQVNPGMKGQVALAEPITACTSLTNPERVAGHFAIVERGSCMFVDKARTLEAAGAIGGIVIDNAPGSSTVSNPVFAMSGDGKDDVSMPMVFLFHVEGIKLKQLLQDIPSLRVYIGKAPLSPDLVVREALLEQPDIAPSCRKTSPLEDKIEVEIKKFDTEDDKKVEGGVPVRLTFHNYHGKPLFRMNKNTETRKIEFQFEENVLQDNTKLKMAKLIEKVVGLIQANMNFGSMDLKEQSDYLFSLGKLMETSVHENSHSVLVGRIKKIMEEELKLKYTDLVDVIEKQDMSDLNDESFKRKEKTNRLKQNVVEMLDTYIEEQLNQVYTEAKEFLDGLGKTQQKDFAKGDTGIDQSLEIPETDDQAATMPDVQHMDLTATKVKDGDSEDKVTGSQPMENFERATKKVRFETKDGEVRHAKYVDFGSGSPKEQEKAIKDHLQTAYDSIEKAIFDKSEAISEEVDSIIKSGVKIKKPPAWMVLKNEEIFVDAEGTIFANYGYKEENNDEETITISYDREKGSETVTVTSGNCPNQGGENNVHKYTYSSVEVKSVDNNVNKDDVNNKDTEPESAGRIQNEHSSSDVQDLQTDHQDLDHQQDGNIQNDHSDQASSSTQPPHIINDNHAIHQSPDQQESSSVRKNIPTVQFDSSFIDLEKETRNEGKSESIEDSAIGSDNEESELVYNEEEQKEILKQSLNNLEDVLSELSETIDDDGGGNVNPPSDSLDNLKDILTDINSDHPSDNNNNNHQSDDQNHQSDSHSSDNDHSESSQDSIAQIDDNL